MMKHKLARDSETSFLSIHLSVRFVADYTVTRIDDFAPYGNVVEIEDVCQSQIGRP